MLKHLNGKFLLSLLLTLFIATCGSEDETPTIDTLDYTTGKNSYRLTASGVERNFHVFVPSGYDENVPVPLVFMFHGSGGNGNATYQNSGWKEVAEQHNFICVFPTGLEYFIVSLNTLQTKWSSTGLDGELQEGVEVVDDIPFVTGMLDQLIATFNIDENRIYASGFSNGGGFSKSRIMCELSDRFAAIGTSGGHALPQVVPVQSNDILALHTIMGTNDDKKLNSAGQTNPFPMDAEEIMSHDYLKGNIDNILEMLQLGDSYDSEAEMPHFNTLRFRDALPANDNEFRFRMVKGMGHIWPNGNNHASGLSAPELFWPFFQEHSK